MPRVLVTGASGFVGGRLLERLAAENRAAVAAVRRRIGPPGDVPAVVIDDIDRHTDWSAALGGCEVVVHTAARVHMMRDAAPDPLAAFRRVNVEGTLNLARQAASAGVRRFVFVSSIKVNGEATLPGRPFRANDPPAPADPYGVSKLEAEQGLFVLARDSGMEVVVVRPVLVYGPGVGANFLSMMRWLRRGLPLPLGALGNRRSLLALDNLVDLLVHCLDHPAAAGAVFLASDGEDLSTPDLLRRLGVALGRPARLLPAPPAFLQAGATLLGRRALAQRLCGSLQVDSTATRERLDWTPPLSVNAALELTAAAFLASERGA